MEFTPSNRDDISRYYRGTFIKLREFGDQLFLINGIDGQKVVGQHESGQPFCIYLDDDIPYNVDYILPHKSFFQSGVNAVQLQRMPAKQYYRGLCASNAQLVYLGPAGLKTLNLDFNILKEFVSKQSFFTLKQAIGADKYTCAMSPRMMYHRSKREIYIDFTPVARVNPAKLTVYVTKPIFLDEVTDLLKATGDIATFKVERYIPPPPKEKTTTEQLLKEMGAKKAPNPELEL